MTGIRADCVAAVSPRAFENGAGSDRSRFASKEKSHGTLIALYSFISLFVIWGLEVLVALLGTLWYSVVDRDAKGAAADLPQRASLLTGGNRIPSGL